MCSDSMMAPCGIDCSQCDIYKAANDPEFAQKLAAQWRETWMPKAQADWFKCHGCVADHSLCWSEDCRIYKCCVENRKLDSCSHCDDFPCEELEKWAAEYPNHQHAFEELKRMRENQP